MTSTMLMWYLKGINVYLHSAFVFTCAPQGNLYARRQPMKATKCQPKTNQQHFVQINDLRKFTTSRIRYDHPLASATKSTQLTNKKKKRCNAGLRTCIFDESRCMARQHYPNSEPSITGIHVIKAQERIALAHGPQFSLLPHVIQKDPRSTCL